MLLHSLVHCPIHKRCKFGVERLKTAILMRFCDVEQAIFLFVCKDKR